MFRTGRPRVRAEIKKTSKTYSLSPAVHQGLKNASADLNKSASRLIEIKMRSWLKAEGYMPE